MQGKYAEAKQACDTLSEFAGSTRTLMCRVPILAVTGHAEEAYASITELLPTAKQRWPSAVQWVLTMQASLATALGHDQLAEQHFQEGLANHPGDKYLLRTYADFLLDRDREEETLSLLHEHTADNGILLRAAIAARRAGHEKQAKEWQKHLENRFEEIRLRGNQPHGRFESRYALELKDDPQLALQIALTNWQKQKEIRDTRNALEAAVAAQDPAKAEPILAFPQGTWHRRGDLAETGQKTGTQTTGAQLMLVFRALLLLSLAIMLTKPAQAHKPSDSYLTITGGGKQLAIKWDIAIKDLEYLIGLDADQNGEITWGELKAKRQAVVAHALSNLKITADGFDGDLQVDDLLVTRHSDGSYAVLVMQTGCPGDASILNIQYHLLFDARPDTSRVGALPKRRGRQHVCTKPKCAGFGTADQRNSPVASVPGTMFAKAFGTSGSALITFYFYCLCCCLQFLCCRNIAWTP